MKPIRSTQVVRHIHDACHLLAVEQIDCDQEVFSDSAGSVSADYQGIIDVAHTFSGQESQLFSSMLRNVVY